MERGNVRLAYPSFFSDIFNINILSDICYVACHKHVHMSLGSLPASLSSSATAVPTSGEAGAGGGRAGLRGATKKRKNEIRYIYHVYI